MLFDFDWLKYGAGGKEIYRELSKFFARQKDRTDRREEQNFQVKELEKDKRNFKNILGMHIYPTIINKLSYLEQVEIDYLYLEYVGDSIHQDTKNKRDAWYEESKKKQDEEVAVDILGLAGSSMNTESKEDFLIEELDTHPLVTITQGTEVLDAVKKLIAEDNSWLVPIENVIKKRAAA